METAWRDVRYVLRGLRRSPGFTATVVITLGIGIGANTAIFSLLNAIVLRTLPLPTPSDLVLLYQSMPPALTDIGDDNRSEIFSYQAFSRIQRATPPEFTVAAMSDAIMRTDVRLGQAQTPTASSLQLVSGRFFQTLEVGPAAGRLFTLNDDSQIDGEPVAVLRYGFAQQQFGSVEKAIGQTVRINAAVLTVVGVVQDGFPGVFMGEPIDIYVPTAMQHAVGYRQNYSTHNAEPLEPWLSQPGIEWLTIVGRGKPGDLERGVGILARAYREEVTADAGRRGESAATNRWQQSVLALESFAGGRSSVRTQFSTALFILMAMVGVVLLIACANIANLLLVRASAKRPELAIRLSLGAGRTRLIRQIVIEGLCLSAIGAVAAVPIGTWAGTGLAELASVRSLLPQGFSLDPALLLFTIGVTTATGVLVGVVPAWRATSNSPATMLAGGASRVTGGARSMNVLVAGQVALSAILIAAAALLGRSLVNLRQFDPGFERQHLVWLRLNPQDVNAFRPADLPVLRDELLRRARAVPGVVNAEVSTTGTLSGNRSVGSIQVEGYVPAAGEQPRAQANRVGPGYLETNGIQLRQGRFIEVKDSVDAPRVAVVNETFAQRYVPRGSALGVHIGQGITLLEIEIVGVVSNARVNGLREAPSPMVFYPLAQGGFPRYLDARVSGDPTVIGASIKRALVDLDPRISVGPPTTIETALARGMSRDRMMAVASMSFAATALLLACVGIYGVVAYRVAGRRREMGVRAALGATPSALARLALGEGFGFAVPGLGVGIAVALAGAHFLETQLFGVNPYDAPTYVAVVVTLLASVLAACHLPARHAAGVDPAVALRSE